MEAIFDPGGKATIACPARAPEDADAASERPKTAARANLKRDPIPFLSGSAQARNTRQVLGQKAPILPLLLAFMAFAEKLDDQLSVFAIGFKRRDMAVLAWLAHRPCLADMIEPQMQVERLVQNVDPRPHRLDIGNRPGVDLDTAAAADKTHDRHCLRGRVVEHGVDRAAIQLPRILLADQPKRLPAVELERTQHAEELMHVGQLAPALAQIG